MRKDLNRARQFSFSHFLPLTLELHRKKPDSNQSVSLARNVYTYQKLEKCVSIVTWSIRCVREKSELCSISFCVWHGSINVPIFVNTVNIKTSEKRRREKLQNPLSHSFLLRTRRSLLNHRSTTVLYSIFNGQCVRKQKRAWLWVNGVKFDLVSPCPVFYFGCEMNWREREWRMGMRLDITFRKIINEKKLYLQLSRTMSIKRCSLIH